MTNQKKEELFALLYEEYGDVGQNGNIVNFIDNIINEKIDKIEKAKLCKHMNLEKDGAGFEEEIGFNKGLDKSITILKE